MKAVVQLAEDAVVKVSECGSEAGWTGRLGCGPLTAEWVGARWCVCRIGWQRCRWCSTGVLVRPVIPAGRQLRVRRKRWTSLVVGLRCRRRGSGREARRDGSEGCFLTPTAENLEPL
jgi:hypothetical protein